jgi:hypothetical protein
VVRIIRILTAFVLAGTLVCGVAAAAEPTRSVSDPWRLIEVGPAERSLEIAYEFGGCEGPGTPRAVQSRLAVAVSVPNEEPLGAVICPAIARIGRVSIDLSGPLAGRHVQGGTRANGISGPFVSGVEEGGRGPAVPRVVGLAPQDARFLLAGLRLRPSVSVVGAVRGLARVVSQSPAADAPVPRNRLVRLNVVR